MWLVAGREVSGAGGAFHRDLHPELFEMMHELAGAIALLRWSNGGRPEAADLPG
jgi:hypothetical protein